MTRQVSLIDGHPIESKPMTIDPVQGEAELLRQLRQTVEDGARWNIGRVHRTINTPTLVLWFLVDPLWERFRFRSAGLERTAAGLCRVMRNLAFALPTCFELKHWLATGDGGRHQLAEVVRIHPRVQ